MALLKQQREKEDIKQYVQSYREMPETVGEFGWLRAASQSVLAEYPWDDKAE